MLQELNELLSQSNNILGQDGSINREALEEALKELSDCEIDTATRFGPFATFKDGFDGCNGDIALAAARGGILRSSDEDDQEQLLLHEEMREYVMQNIVPLMPNQELNTWQQAVEPTTTTPNEHLQQVQRQTMPPPESPPADRQVPRRRMSDRQVSDSVKQRQPVPSEERSNTTTLTCSVASETSHGGQKCNTTSTKQPLLQGNGVQKTSKKCKSCDRSFMQPNRDSIGVQAIPLSTTIQRLTSGGGGDHYNRPGGAVITADI